MTILIYILLAAAADQAASPAPKPANAIEEDGLRQLLGIRRVFVDRLTGGETAAQMRDILISSLQGTKLFVLTENQERADAILRGAAEDLIYTDQFQSSDSVDLRSGVSTGSRSSRTSSGARSLSVGVGDKESTDIHERKHEALATVRLVNKDGDVIWSTTQESNGAKFRGASADVADKITRQLTADLDRARQGRE
jgi:hypothetical protein